MLSSILASLLLLLSPCSVAAHTVSVEIDGIQPAKGVVFLAVYKTDDGFPWQMENAWQILRATADSKGRCYFDLSDLPAGPLAFAAFHDRDENGRLDTKVSGVPLEGVGVSNNRIEPSGSSAFRDCLVDIQSDQRIRIQLNYF